MNHLPGSPGPGTKTNCAESRTSSNPAIVVASFLNCDLARREQKLTMEPQTGGGPPITETGRQSFGFCSLFSSLSISLVAGRKALAWDWLSVKVSVFNDRAVEPYARQTVVLLDYRAPISSIRISSFQYCPVKRCLFSPHMRKVVIC
jgi:hypothetical protein